MKRAFVIALAVHLCLLLGASSIYILPPENEKRKRLFEIEIVDIKRFEPAVEQLRIAPPKKIREHISTPLKCEVKLIELITVNEIIVPEFTMNLLEPSTGLYLPKLPGIAVVRRPERQTETLGCRRFRESDFYGGGIHHSVCRGFYHKGHRSFSFLNYLRPILHLWGSLVNESSTLD